MDAATRVARARAQLVADHPFFGSLAMRLLTSEHPEVETLATDGTNLWYGKDVELWADETLRFLVAHTVTHCALRHHVRRGGRDAERWNIAADYAVNAVLREAGLTELPPWALYDAAYACLTAEAIYARLEPAPADAQAGGPRQRAVNATSCGRAGAGGDPPTPGGGKPTGTDGTIAAGAAAGGGMRRRAGGGGWSPGRAAAQGVVLDAAPAHDQAALDQASDEWDVYTRQAANVAKRAAGKVPGFVEQIIRILETPLTDWRAVLRQFIDPSTVRDYSWMVLSRRHLGLGCYSPGTVPDGISHIGVGVDTSGSVNEALLAKFGSELQQILDEGMVDKVTVMFADTRVHRVAEYVRGERLDFTVQGRGGTRFSPTIEKMVELGDVSLMLYFTDLECSDFGPIPPFPVLWVTPAGTKYPDPPFGAWVGID